MDMDRYMDTNRQAHREEVLRALTTHMACVRSACVSRWVFTKQNPKTCTEKNTTPYCNSTAQHSTAQHSTAQRSAAHIAAQHSAVQRSAAQHSTAQHSTAQRSAAQHSTLQCAASGVPGS